MLYQIDVTCISCFVIKVQKMTFTKLLVLVHSSVLNMLLFSFLNIIPLALVFKTCTLQETTSSKGGIIFFCISVELYNSYKYDRVCINNWYTYKQKSRDYIIVSFIFPREKNQSNLTLTYNIMTYFRYKNDHYFYVCKSAITVGWCFV